MGSEEASSRPQLPLFSCVPLMVSQEPSGTHTPPLQTSASVPFQWEEEPGKPRPCTALVALPIDNPATNKCLELQLPPRLQQQQQQQQQLMDYCNTITKSPSPTTVFKGPYDIFPASPLRLGSFDGSRCSETFQIGALLLEKRSSSSSSPAQKGNGLLRSWAHMAQKSKKTLKHGGSERKANEGSLAFSPYSVNDEVKMARNKRHGGFLSISHARSNFWATMLKRFKQLIPWKNRVSKKQAHAFIN